MWAPKYRKWVLRGDIQDRVRELFLEIGDRYDVETSRVGDSGGPRSSVCLVSTSTFDIRGSWEDESDLGEGHFRGVSGGRAGDVRRESPRQDGYFARTVEDEVTTKVIRRYIEYHDEEETRPNQLDLFDQ